VSRLKFLPVPCHHCEDAPCAKACPTGAIQKKENGIVTVDPKKCIGCHECLWACPYGVPQFNDQGKMTKCSLCAERVEEGLEPACVRACPAEAPMFGTAEEIREVLKKRYPGQEYDRLVKITERAGDI
jgi:Fe-S-cluster-containing dehydrogenase component